MLQTHGISNAGVPALLPVDPAISARHDRRVDEVEDVRALLLEHADPRAGTPEQCAAVADTVALACLGDNHLWQDLRFQSRAELSALMRHWFPVLVAKNSADMKWKKFLYKQLCDREGLSLCRAPSCDVCTDRPVCFGPER